MGHREKYPKRRLGKKPLALLVLLAAGVVCSIPISADSLPGERVEALQLQYCIEVTQDELHFRHVHGYDLVELRDGGFLAEPAKPMLPSKQVRIALPPGMSAQRVELLAATQVTLPGSFRILPAQPPVAVGSHPDQHPFVEPDREIYGSMDVYPVDTAVLTGQTDLAGQGMAVVTLHPLQYLPAEGTLSLCTSITIGIELASGYECRDFLPEGTSVADRGTYEETLREMVINPQDVQVRFASGLFLPTTLEPGEYAYVIIAGATLASGFEPLVEWKTRKGVPAKIVTTSWIYDEGGYSGSDEEQIRAFIIDAHNEWGTTYFLLGGDTNTIPCHRRDTPVNPYTIPNDTYYADFDDDWTVEVHVGRASVRYSSYVYTFNSKIFNYEKNPPLTGYGATAAMFGFDLDSDTAGEECKADIVSDYFPGSWDVTTVYDSDAGNHKDDVIAAFNAGQNLVNHIDHADSGELGVGSVHHDLWIYASDVYTLTNELEQSIIYSIGCYACNFELNTCISEVFVRGADGGAIAMMGNARFGWFNPGLLNTLSMRYDRQFFSSLFDGGQHVLGDCFSAHKNAFYPAGDYYRYVFTELTLLGDPELPIWTADPAGLVVAHPELLWTAPAEFSVRVEDAGGGALSGALVCLWKDDEIYLRDYTDGGGSVTFFPDAATDGTLLVTVTKHNCLPYEGEALVLDSSGDVDAAGIPSAFVLYGNSLNPFDARTEIRFGLPEAGRVALQVFDISGRLVRELVAGETLAAGVHAVTWDGRDGAGRSVSSGVYLCRLDAGRHQQTRRMVLSR
jgi:hypothetical protein